MKNIKETRESKRITLKELSSKTSLSVTVLSNIEQGKVIPNESQLKSIYSALE